MTRIALEFDFDLETSYTPEVPAKLSPPPGEPPAPEEIEIITVNRIWVEDCALAVRGLDVDNLLGALLAIDPIRQKIEQAVRDEANG